MPSISNDEYEEYQQLKSCYRRQILTESISRASLIDDIDEPIRRSVIALALLGCDPIWSCCGFDYVGQPIHKSHQYGRIFVIMSANKISRCVAGHISSSFHTWKTSVVENMHGTCLDLHADFHNTIPQWDNPYSVHYYENAAVLIQELELFLFQYKSLFAETATIIDSNMKSRQALRYWQYPTKNPAVVTRADLGL